MKSESHVKQSKRNMSAEDMEVAQMEQYFRFNSKNAGNPSCRKRSRTEKLRCR